MRFVSEVRTSQTGAAQVIHTRFADRPFELHIGNVFTDGFARILGQALQPVPNRLRAALGFVENGIQLR